MDYLDLLIELSFHRVPFDEWPEELKAIGGLSEDCLGPVIPPMPMPEDK